MSYMLTVATAFIRGSIAAALRRKPPLPQTPMTPIRFTVDERTRAQIVHGGAEILDERLRGAMKCGCPPLSPL